MQYLGLAVLLLLGLLVTVERPRTAAAAEETAGPYRMLVLLDVVFPGTRGTCTGFEVGPHTIATAGHCLFNPQNGGWATSIAVIPGVDGVTAPFARQVATIFTASPEYVATGNPSHDYSAITLGSDLLAPVVGQFDLSLESDRRLSSGSFETAGYSSTVTWGTQWRMPQQRPLLGFDSTIVAYDWGTAAGMSGAPIFEVAGGGYRAFGIVTGSVTVLGKPVEVGLRTNQKTIEFYRAAILSPSAAPADPPVRDAFTTTPGRSVTVRSTSSAAPDAPLVLQSSTDRVRWTTIATGATDHTGAGAFRIAPTHTQYYRFVARGVGPGPVSQGIVTGAASKTSFAAISGAAAASTARDAFAPWPSFVDGNASMVVFRGGSLDDLDAAIADAGGGAAWLQRADGGWCLYVVGAPAFVSDGVTQAFPAGLPGTTAVTVVPRGASLGSR